MIPSDSYILPAWPAPMRVRAAATTRRGGFSLPPYDSFNLGAGAGDDPIAVAANRERLARALELPAEPAWLRQVHGNAVVTADALHGPTERGPTEADAAYTRTAGRVCVVMTADCLPVFLTHREGEVAGVAHAGWRGLARSVIGATVRRMDCAPDRLLAWLGPAIGPDAFEVGPEVRDEFLALDAANAECFRPSPAGRWLADLYALARRQLHALGVEQVYGGGFCTYAERERFFSYRRDGRTGRMANLIWLSD